MTPTEQIAFHQLAIDYWTAREQGEPFDVQYQTERGHWINWRPGCYGSCPVVVFDHRWTWRRKPKEPRRCWVRWEKDLQRETHPNRFSCDAAARGYGGECVEMVEVVMEDAK